MRAVPGRDDVASGYTVSCTDQERVRGCDHRFHVRCTSPDRRAPADGGKHRLPCPSVSRSVAVTEDASASATGSTPPISSAPVAVESKGRRRHRDNVQQCIGGGGHRPRGRNRGDDYNGGGGGGEPHRCAVGAHGGGRRGPVGAHPEETQRRTTGTTGRVAVEEARWWRREGVADPATGCLWDSVRLSLGQPAGCPAPFKLLRPQQAHVRGHAHRGGHRPTRQRTARRAWTQQEQPIRDGVGG